MSKDDASKPETKQFEIIVNGRPKTVTTRELTFSQIVALAAVETGAAVAITVTYKRGEGNKPEGTLVEGESVRVKDGMIFNVTATNRS